MDIHILNRDQIDTIKWNARVAKSGNGLPYALVEYLDIVTNRNWCALVDDDYEAIFPLPFEFKLGIKMYLQPPFTQQLGLIAEKHTNSLLSIFLRAIPLDFNLLHLKGNEASKFSTESMYLTKRRTNLILSLKDDYDVLYSRYSKSLRKRIRKNLRTYEIKESVDVEFVVSNYRKEMRNKLKLKSGHYKIARMLFKYLLDSNQGTIYIAKRKGQIDCALFVLQYQNRLINLFGASNQSGKKHFAMHLILDQIIRLNSSSNQDLDFEGSDIPGVQEFYKSFGPVEVYYPEYYEEQFPTWYRVLLKAKFW